MKKGRGSLINNLAKQTGFGVEMNGRVFQEPPRLARRRQERKIKKLLAKSGK